MANPVKITGVDKAGIIKDSPAHSLLPQVWTDAKNVRFHDGTVSKMPGEIKILAPIQTIGGNDVDPVHVAYWPNPLTPQYVYTNKTHVYTMNEAGGIHNINKNSTPYTPSENWHSAIFTGGYALVMNSTLSIPQYVIDTTTDSSVPDLQDLPGWTYGTTTDVKAGILQSFNNALIAGDITATVDGTVVRAPGTIRISTQAPPGSIPQTWEPGLTSDTADEFELSTTSPVVAMVEMQGQMICLTHSSIHAVGVSAAASTAKIVTDSYGTLGRNSVANFDGQMLSVGSDDIFTFSGHPASIKSIADARVRNAFYSDLSPLYSDKTFIVPNRRYDEIWICYPNLTSTGKCNTALIWNYRANTWTTRNLPNVSAGTVGPIDGGGIASQTISFSGAASSASDGTIQLVFDSETINVALNTRTIDQIIGDIDAAVESVVGIQVLTDTDNARISFISNSSTTGGNILTAITFTPGTGVTDLFGVYSSDTNVDSDRPWQTGTFNHSKSFVVLANEGNLIATDLSFTDLDDNIYVSYVERSLMDPVGSEGVTKDVQKVYPMLDGEGSVTITTSGQNTIGGAKTKDKEYIYEINSDYKVDIYSNTRWFNIKFSDQGDTLWRLSGYDLIVELDSYR